MTISVFTPTNATDHTHLQELYGSLCKQTKLPDEWVVLLNGDAPFPAFENAPFYIVTRKVQRNDGNIGALKAEACGLCHGDIMVEVDHDDLLTQDALKEIETAFLTHENVRFVYSDAYEFKPDGTANVYDGCYGWRHREDEQGWVNVAFPEQAQYMRRIEWAPNHVRAWLSSAYNELGGHDENIAVGDDHELVCRFYIAYGAAGFFHIEKTLYLYRVHDGNTSNGRNRNAEVQAQVDVNYCTHAEQMYLRWAADNGLLALDLGGRIACPDGYKSVDLLDADIIADLNRYWPMEDNSVGVLRAYHVLEHLDDPIHFFNEAYRVLAPGGFLLIEVPSVNGAGAFGDPTHKKFFNLLTFEYFTNQQYARFIQPKYTGRFQKARVVEYWWDNPRIPVISAQLIALKGWYDQRWCGLKKM